MILKCFLKNNNKHQYSINLSLRLIGERKRVKNKIRRQQQVFLKNPEINS